MSIASRILHVKAGLRRRRRNLAWRYSRLTLHFNRSIHATLATLSVLTFIAAVTCIVALLVYVGYDHNTGSLATLRHVLTAVQWIFTVNVTANIVLDFKHTVRNSRIIKWIVDIAILTAIFTLIYPEPQRPWFPALADILYNNYFIGITLAAYSLVDISYGLMHLLSRRTNPSLILSSSFILLILIGSFVFMLPRCTHIPMSYTDSVFLATSAVCITGLSPVDISTTLTPTGLAVLAVLVQIGGLGIITFTSFFAIFFSGGTSVYNQLLIRDVVYSRTMNALVPTMLYVLGFTVVIELLGAVAIYFTIPPELGMDSTARISFAALHSLMSFCNAGFSNLPDGMANPYLLHGDQNIYIVTSVLILAGSIGFPILVNFKDIIVGRAKRLIHRLTGRTRPDRRLHIYDLNTKLVLITSLTVLALSSIAFFVLEFDNTLAGMSLRDKAVQSVFNSLIPRSAGFASVNPANFMPVTMMLIVAQMWIGGASQSMAGGIKVNTLGAIILNLRAVITGRAGATAFHRRLSAASVQRSNAVLVLVTATFFILCTIIIMLEPQLGIKELCFEVTSALFTVGSSLGVTQHLGDTSKILLCVAMFIGRVGIISLLSGMFSTRRDPSAHYPEDSIIIN